MKKTTATKPTEQKSVKSYSIDASGMSVGRVAAQAAKALMGKSHADYTPNIVSLVKVTISNAGKIRITEKKRLQKKYTDYSGHPGGLKIESLGSLIGRRGKGAAVRRAVERMIPRNTMKTSRLKRLIINE